MKNKVYPQKGQDKGPIAGKIIFTFYRDPANANNLNAHTEVLGELTAGQCIIATSNYAKNLQAQLMNIPAAPRPTPISANPPQDEVKKENTINEAKP